MMGFSQSQFLHALGWATLNSFWQMALLWCVYLAAKTLFNLSANQKYQLSVGGITVGFFWAVSTFLFYFITGNSLKLDLFAQSLSVQTYLPLILTTTSVTYILLLFIPAYRLFLNWRHTQVLRQNGLQKIDIQYKLFVKKIALRVGIKQKVFVFISDLIKSPITIGYLKPMILLPLASINNLTIHQVEAVLLHELSHIKRFDYIINLFLNIAHTILYFNPFVKLFLRVVEEERENCCDQMVLQFGYDKVSYASALLALEKTSSHAQILEICATGKKNLLARIEKIVGLEKKPVFNFNHLGGFIAALLCIFAINSLLITSNEQSPSLPIRNPVNPLYLLYEEESIVVNSPKNNSVHDQKRVPQRNSTNTNLPKEETVHIPPPPPALEPDNNVYIYAASDEADARLTEKEKNKIDKTVERAKKVLATYEWKEIEKAIGDVLTDEEKQVVKREYLKEVERINWGNVEKNLKAEYEKIDWEKVNFELNSALLSVKIDSLINVYERSYNELVRVSNMADSTQGTQNSMSSLPLPDESKEAIESQKVEIKRHLDVLKSLRKSDIIKL